MDDAISVCVAVAVAFDAVFSTLDGRSFRAPITNHFVIPSNTWTIVQNSPIHDAWFIRHLRCTRGTYQRICQNVEVAWQRVHPPLHHHNTMSVNDRVACTLHYLTHSGGYESTAALFGISKTRAYEYCNQVALVIQLCYVLETIVLPSSREEWEVVRVGFEEHGFPNAYGAIDGSLIQVKRFEDFYGWYCRKGFPAFNMQAVVDHRMRFIPHAIYVVLAAFRKPERQSHVQRIVLWANASHKSSPRRLFSW
ncbi:hypothetical protein AaE_015158 [Aphanomyces astaci]|uniref:DDE Tnp4 domain-containing protein n=1 Tax=Aphanomyces astaci TaxID=112090 RepID=A0A6A4Z4D7_APHAT|nr:hypothetical protein AaE_015158 [Aphanomyces astaci]